MSRIIEAIEAKQSELERRKENMKQAVDSVLNEYRQNMESYIAELRQATEQSMTELRQQHANELREQTRKLKAGYKAHMMALWCSLLILMGAFGATAYLYAEAIEQLQEMDNRQQWLWLVNEKAIKAEAEKQQKQRQNSK